MGSAQSLGVERPQKITFGEMRKSGVRGVLIYCSDYHCSHHITASADPWPDHIRLTDLERRFVCNGMWQARSRYRAGFSLG
jgi:hypothetical protein